MDENKTNNQMNLNIIPQDNYGDNNALNNPPNQNQNNTEKELLIKQLNEDLGLELTTSQINQNLNNNTNTIQKTTKTNYYNFHDNMSRLSFISKIDDKKEDDKNNMEFDQDIFIPKTYDEENLMSFYGGNNDILNIVNDLQYNDNMKEDPSTLVEDYLKVIEFDKVNMDQILKITQTVNPNDLKDGKKVIKAMEYEGKIIPKISEFNLMLFKAKDIDNKNMKDIQKEIENKSNILYAWRDILPGNDSFFRAIMFSFLEDIILSGNVNYYNAFLYKLIKNMENSYFIKILKFYNIDCLRTKIYLILIYYAMNVQDSESPTLNAYTLFNKIYDYDSNFDSLLILNLKFLIFEYLKNNEKKLYTKQIKLRMGKLLPSKYQSKTGYNFKSFYESNLLQLYHDAERITISVIPFILRRDLYIYYFRENKIKFYLVHTDNKENKEYLPFRLFFLNGSYQIIYPKDYYNQFQNIFSNFSNINKNTKKKNNENIKIGTILENIDEDENDETKPTNVIVNEFKKDNNDINLLKKDQLTPRNVLMQTTINTNANNILQQNNVNTINQINNIINDLNLNNNNVKQNGNLNLNTNYIPSNDMNNKLKQINNNYMSMANVGFNNMIMNKNIKQANNDLNLKNDASDNSNNNNNMKQNVNNNLNIHNNIKQAIKNNLNENVNNNMNNNNINDNLNINKLLNDNNENNNNLDKINNNLKHDNNNNNNNYNIQNMNRNNVINAHNNNFFNYGNHNPQMQNKTQIPTKNNINPRFDFFRKTQVNTPENKNNKGRLRTNTFTNMQSINALIQQNEYYSNDNDPKTDNFRGYLTKRGSSQAKHRECPICRKPVINNFYCQKCILNHLIPFVQSSYILFVKNNIGNIIKNRPKETLTEYLANLVVTFANNEKKKFNDSFLLLSDNERNIFNEKINNFKSSICLGCFIYVNKENTFTFRLPCGCIFCSVKCLNLFINSVPIKHINAFTCACGVEYNFLQLKFLLYFAISHNLNNFKNDIMRLMYENIKNKCCKCNKTLELNSDKSNNVNIMEVKDREAEQIFGINKFNHLICDKCVINKEISSKRFCCSLCLSEHIILSQQNLKNCQISNSCSII